MARPEGFEHPTTWFEDLMSQMIGVKREFHRFAGHEFSTA